MVKPRQIPTPEEDSEEDMEPIAPLPRSSNSSESELDEYIHLGEEQPSPEEDIFADVPEEEEEDAAAPIPRIERDTKLEEEIEQEKYVPIEELIADIQEVGQSLDPVRMYLRDIGRHPLLTADEELELAQKIEDGVKAEAELAEFAGRPDADLSDQELDHKDELELAVTQGRLAHNRLAQSNLRLVVSVAKRYIGRGLNFLDLIQEGNLGLLRAVDKFDHTLGFKFSTYANMVDPAGHQPGDRRPGAHDPDSGTHGRDDQPPGTRAAAAAAGAWTRTFLRGSSIGNGVPRARRRSYRAQLVGARRRQARQRSRTAAGTGGC